MNSDWPKILIAFFGTLFITSCEKVIQPEVPTGVSINARLASDQFHQRLYVHSITPSDQQISPNEAFVSNLSINVSQLPNTWQFGVFADSVVGYPPKSYRSLDTIPITPGGAYDLSITGNGLEVFGRTVVPSDFSIFPQPSFQQLVGRINYDLSWTGSLGAEGYLVDVDIRGENFGFRSQINVVVETEDTTASGTIDLFGLFDPDTCIVKVTANDANYWRTVIKGEDTAGLSTGLGFFGSSLSRQDTVILN